MCHLGSCKTPLCLLSWLQRQYRRSGSAIWITLTFSPAPLGPKQFCVEPGRGLRKGSSVIVLQSAFTAQRRDGLEACLLGRCPPPLLWQLADATHCLHPGWTTGARFQHIPWKFCWGPELDSRTYMERTNFFKRSSDLTLACVKHACAHNNINNMLKEKPK